MVQYNTLMPPPRALGKAERTSSHFPVDASSQFFPVSLSWKVRSVLEGTNIERYLPSYTR